MDAERGLDFARYEIVVTGGGVRRVFLVGDPSEDSLGIDAKPVTTYTVVVTVVDPGGQWASSRAVSVTTPRVPDPPDDEVLAVSPGPGILR